MSSILLEKYLASEFKFGFELEAFYKEAYEEFEDEDDIEEGVQEDIAKAFNIPLKDVTIKYDGSLEPYENEDYAFEWATPTMQFTPTNIKKSIEGLDALIDNGYYTNKTCGFHVHLSFPNISDMDTIWILSHLSIDSEIFYRLINFDGLEFFDEHYADINFIKDIGDAIYNEDYEELKRSFNTDKYRAFHIHPQGTIEWRGPRNFLNDYDIDTVKEFFKLLYDFVRWISKTIVKKDINGMSKDTYMKLIYGKEYEEGSLISDFNFKNKNKILSDKIEKDINNNECAFLIKLLSQYDKTKNNNIKAIIKKYFQIIENEIYNTKFFTEVIHKILSLNLISVFFNLDSQNNFIKNIALRQASIEDCYKILVMLYEQENYIFLLSALDFLIGFKNEESVRAFVTNYFSALPKSFIKALLNKSANTFKFYLPFINNASYLNEQYIYDRLKIIILYSIPNNKNIASLLANTTSTGSPLYFIKMLIKYKDKIEGLNGMLERIFISLMSFYKSTMNTFGANDSERYEYASAYDKTKTISELLN